jgi:hypothetical protein
MLNSRVPFLAIIPSLDRGELRPYNSIEGSNKGGEEDEVDVSPCNALFSMWLNAVVPSMTLNGSSMDERSPVKLNKRSKSRLLVAGFFLFGVMIRSR